MMVSITSGQNQRQIMLTNLGKRMPSPLIQMDIYTLYLLQVITMISFTAYMMEFHGLQTVSKAVKARIVGILTWLSMTMTIFMLHIQAIIITLFT